MNCVFCVNFDLYQPFSDPCWIHGHIPISLAAGFPRDRLGSYNVAFYLAGIPPIFGGAVLCLIPWVEARRKRGEKEALKKEQDVTQKMIEHEKAQEDAQCKTGESVL